MEVSLSFEVVVAASWELPSLCRRQILLKRRYTFTTLYGVTRQRDINLLCKTNLRTIDLYINADIKIQVTIPLPTICIGFLDVSAPLKPVKQFQVELLQKGNRTREGENRYRKNTLPTILRYLGLGY